LFIILAGSIYSSLCFIPAPADELNFTGVTAKTAYPAMIFLGGFMLYSAYERLYNPLSDCAAISPVLYLDSALLLKCWWWIFTYNVIAPIIAFI